MFSSPPSLDELLPLAKHWLPTEHGYFVAYAEDEFGNFEEYLFSRAELASHHALLPEIIEAGIAAEVASGNAAQVVGLHIDATLKLSTYPGVRYHDLHGRERLMVFVFNTYERPELPELVYVVGYHLDVQETVIAGQTVPLVIDNHFDDFCVEIEELDTRYPGWYQRNTLAKELGVRGEDYMRFVFPADPVVDLPLVAPLPDVNYG